MNYDFKRSQIQSLALNSPSTALKQFEILLKSYPDEATAWNDVGNARMEHELHSRGHALKETLKIFEKALELDRNNDEIKQSYYSCKKHQITKKFNGQIEHITLPIPVLPKDRPDSHMASMLDGTFVMKNVIPEDKLKFITLEYLKDNYGDITVGYLSSDKSFQINKTAVPTPLSMYEALSHLEQEDQSYVMWNMNYAEHKQFMNHFDLLDRIAVDEYWLKNIITSDELRDEFLKKTHWYQMVIGSKDAGMFNHHDGFMNAGWHLHIRGKKRWHICHPNNTINIKKYTSDGVGETNCYSPNYESHPDFRKVVAYVSEFSSGDILYYPGKFWHQTHNIEDINITFTCSGTNKSNIKDIIYAMKSCIHKGKPYAFSQGLCNSLNEVFSYWDKQYNINSDSIFDASQTD